MNAIRHFKILALLLIVFLYAPRLCAENPQSPEIFRAAKVAYEDFSAKLNQESGDAWEYAGYVANIKNYNIGLSGNDKYYIVVFLLKKSAANIKGGGGEYKIRKNDLKIVGFLGYS